VTYEICPIGPDELSDLYRAVSTAFGDTMSDEALDDERLITEYDRMIGVADNGQFVAGAGAYSFDHTLPGDTIIPVAGVTWVGCLPSHRRRGILTSMMRHQLDDVAERGEAVAILTASEAVIYGRFGYGLSTQARWAKVKTSRGRFAREPEASGRIRFVWGDERAKVIPPVFDQWRRTRPGSVDRNEGKWKGFLLDRERDRRGASSLYTVVHEDTNGSADGYASYRVRQGREAGAVNTVVVQEVVALDPEVEAALWRFLLDIDLAEAVEAQAQPLDSILPWRLHDHRAYRTTYVGDFLWTRVLDVPAALSARRYAIEGSLIIDVVDEFRPDGAANGRFRLDAARDGATCAPVDRSVDADVAVTIAALGSTYLGGVRWTTLAAGGRASGTADALHTADLLFSSSPLPFCNTEF
jgi:predicted acetyltransferase